MSHPGSEKGCFLNRSGFSLCQSFIVCKGVLLPGAGFGNWMRDRCDEAGLPNCSSHGLRKACARRLAEAECTHHEIKAITGHKTDAEVRRYTAKADQVLPAHSAFEKLQDTANNPKPANHL